VDGLPSSETFWIVVAVGLLLVEGLITALLVRFSTRTDEPHGL
jgi:hypothetical protein